ncbi:hypothetical protein PINS_up023284 [Pythium insidiosum]|nr:hypothetical protein PINS_up023284 [Pythium insidiosum]
MLRRVAVRTLKQTSAVHAARTFASSSAKQASASTKSRSAGVALAIAGVATIGGSLAVADLVHAREKQPDIEQIKKEIVDIFEDNNFMGPTLVRLAVALVRNLQQARRLGGSTGGTIRFSPEINHGGNAGLHLAVKRAGEGEEEPPGDLVRRSVTSWLA